MISRFNVPTLMPEDWKNDPKYNPVKKPMADEIQDELGIKQTETKPPAMQALEKAGQDPSILSTLSGLSTTTTGELPATEALSTPKGLTRNPKMAALRAGLLY